MAIFIAYMKARGEPNAVFTRATSVANATRSVTGGRLYVYDTILERLPPHRQHVACALGPLVEEENAVMRPRHLPRHGQLPAAVPAGVGDRVGRGATGAVWRPVRPARL